MMFHAVATTSQMSRRSKIVAKSSNYRRRRVLEWNKDRLGTTSLYGFDSSKPIANQAMNLDVVIGSKLLY